MHITHVHPQVDYYHGAQTMPYMYISIVKYNNIHTLSLYPRTYPAKVQT